MVILALALASSASPVAAASTTKECKAVVNTDVGPGWIDLTEPSPELMELFASLPPEIQGLLADVRAVYADGSLHLNLIATEKKGSLDVNLHLSWHGTIALGDEAHNVLVEVDAKNAQVVAHLDIPLAGISGTEFMVHAHANADATIAGAGAGVVDFSFGVMLKYQAGELTGIKISLPGILDALI